MLGSINQWLAVLLPRGGTFRPHYQWLRWYPGPAQWGDVPVVSFLIDGQDGHVMDACVHADGGVASLLTVPELDTWLDANYPPAAFVTDVRLEEAQALAAYHDGQRLRAEGVAADLRLARWIPRLRGSKWSVEFRSHGLDASGFCLKLEADEPLRAHLPELFGRVYRGRETLDGSLIESERTGCTLYPRVTEVNGKQKDESVVELAKRFGLELKLDWLIEWLRGQRKRIEKLDAVRSAIEFALDFGAKADPT